MRFGDKSRKVDSYPGPAGIGFADLEDLFGQPADAQQVIFGFGRQADHKIELDRLDPFLKGGLDAVQNILLGQIFPDHVAQALSAGLGGESDAAAAHARDLFGQFDRKGIGAH